MTRRSFAIALRLAVPLAALATAGSGLAGGPGSPAGASPPAAAKIFVRDAGVYRVGFEQLVAAGLAREPLPSAALSLSAGGAAVPIWVADGGDGRLGPGDGIEFVGQRLAGEHSYFNPYSELNVYRLRFDDSAPLRMSSPAKAASRPRASLAAGAMPRFERRLHLEQDDLLLRFSKAGEDEIDLWYWAKLGWADREPLSLPLELPGRDPAAAEPVRLRLALRGWSWQREEARRLRDHRVEVAWNGVPLGSGEWDGQGELVLDLPKVPAEALTAGPQTLTLKVPPRIAPQAQPPAPAPAAAPVFDDDTALGPDEAASPAPATTSPQASPRPPDPIVDVAVLNWVEVSYPALPVAPAEADQLHAVQPTPVPPASRKGASPRPSAAPGAASTASAPWRAAIESTAPVVIYGEAGSRVEAQPAGPAKPDGSRPYAFSLAAAERSFYAVAGGRLREPEAVAGDWPSDLHATGRQADYLMIAHPTLRQAIEPLAALHRQRGLTVEVVDVDDVYDEFSHGVVTPQALRDFVSHAYHHWERPAPRFVLLVGDASWDPRATDASEDRNYVDWAFAPRDGARFRKNRSTPYAPEALERSRNLIPTGVYYTNQGHAASDNEFVAVDGKDRFPDLAIGRLPVVTPEEVAAIVAKTSRYLTAPEPGPWRQRVLWITNEDVMLQRHSDRLAEALAARGFESRKVYPGATSASNSMLQESLRQSFDEGFALVHFHGHGGRYIWRTGLADLEKNSDLFTLEDLDRLTPSARLAVVLSMTCYSAPFDHPTADSIGEKLLRLPDKGAVAVFAASWRNSPLTGFSQAVIEEVLAAKTLGEGLVKAKRRAVTMSLIEQYNLLGDPALEMPPRSESQLTAAVP